MYMSTYTGVTNFKKLTASFLAHPVHMARGYLKQLFSVYSQIW